MGYTSFGTDNSVFNEMVSSSDDTKGIQKIVSESEDPYTKVIKIRENAMPRQNEDGTVSTHLMVWGEDEHGYYAHPTLFPTIEEGHTTGWTELDDGAYEKALEEGEIFRFDTAKQAEEFAGPNAPWKTGEHPSGYIHIQKHVPPLDVEENY